MVSSKAIKFDFDMQLWRQDLLLSANVLGIDVKAYLDGLLTTLPVASRPILEARLVEAVLSQDSRLLAIRWLSTGSFGRTP